MAVTKRWVEINPEAWIEFLLSQPSDSEGWRPARRPEVQDATGMGQRSHDKCRQMFVNAGVIEVRFGNARTADDKHIPGGCYLYRVDREKLRQWRADRMPPKV